jgi:hypothetical protein
MDSNNGKLFPLLVHVTTFELTTDQFSTAAIIAFSCINRGLCSLSWTTCMFMDTKPYITFDIILVKSNGRGPGYSVNG